MSEIKAAIFDLDGVLTQTASLHAKAWKRMFDDYNTFRAEQGEEPYGEFIIREDYAVHLDGKPRYDGVRSFLQSRGVELLDGHPDDAPGWGTVCSLGNRKNVYFHELLRSEGVDLIQENVEKVKDWKARGLKTAVISSSKNCGEILKRTGLDSLFDVRVDGVISEKLHLKGKPDPAIFLEAARQLKVDPGESLIVEDALAGLEAGKKGKFGVVIGIDDGHHSRKMREHGADVLVRNLMEYDPFEGDAPAVLPDALDHLALFRKEFRNHNALLCLDYDGTLTPIVEDYTQAFLSEEMRALLKSAACVLPVAIVSGRDITFIKEQVGLEELYYAGSHGFEIEGPADFHHDVPDARELLPVLDRIETQLDQELRNTGAEVERKKYAIAVHYRQVDEEHMATVERAVDSILAKNPALIRAGGKKVIEIRPAMEWHKGKAVEELTREIQGDTRPGKVMYLGDDLTDEDVFCGLKQRGYGILIGSPGQKTCADYYLRDVDEVMRFLRQLIKPGDDD